MLYKSPSACYLGTGLIFDYVVVGEEGEKGQKRDSPQNLDLHGLASLWTSSFGKKIRQFFIGELSVECSHKCTKSVLFHSML